MELKQASQRIEFSSCGATSDPAACIDRDGLAAVSTRKCTEIGENTIFPAKAVAQEAVWVVTVVRGVGIGKSRICVSNEYPPIIEMKYSWPDAGIAKITCRPAERTDVDEFVASVLRGQWSRQRQRSEESDDSNCGCWIPFHVCLPAVAPCLAVWAQLCARQHGGFNVMRVTCG